MTPQQLCIAHARSLVGAKWRHRGRKPWGVDCIGLVVLSLDAGGIHLKDRRDYGREPWKDGLRRELFEQMGEPVVGDWMPGDVALMKFDQHPEPGHVGLIADHPMGGLSLIHSYSLVSVCEQSLSGKWLKRIVEVYRPWPR